MADRVKHINEIAAEMLLSPSTISTYRERILKKLGMRHSFAMRSSTGTFTRSRSMRV